MLLLILAPCQQSLMGKMLMGDAVRVYFLVAPAVGMNRLHLSVADAFSSQCLC